MQMFVLGYINPDYYYGGRMRLDKNRSIHGDPRKNAKPLGVSVEEGAKLFAKSSMAIWLRRS